MNTYHRQDGFGLLEALISVLILSIGLVGVAMLQINAMKRNQEAQFQAMVLAQAQNMIDRMTQNPTGVANGAYDNASGIPADPGCVSASCTESQVAQKDINYWNTMNAQLLPSGQGTIVRNGSIYTISIFWDAFRTGATGTNCSGNTAVDLSCFRIQVQL